MSFSLLDLMTGEKKVTSDFYLYLFIKNKSKKKEMRLKVKKEGKN